MAAVGEVNSVLPSFSSHAVVKKPRTAAGGVCSAAPDMREAMPSYLQPWVPRPRPSAAAVVPTTQVFLTSQEAHVPADLASGQLGSVVQATPCQFNQ